MKPTKRDLFKYRTTPNSLSTTKSTTTKRALPLPPRAPTLDHSQQDLCTTLKRRQIKRNLCYTSNDAKELGVDDCLQRIVQKHGFSKILNLRRVISFFIDGVKIRMSPRQEVTGQSDWVVGFLPWGRWDKWLPMNFGCFGGLFMERDHNTGSITMGSFITIFAKHVGVELSSFVVLSGHPLLNIKQMESNYK
ncbi:L-arabinose transport system permease protein AraH [Bienertia sinuspersici]